MSHTVPFDFFPLSVIHGTFTRNGDEEFWYFNIANEFADDLPPGTTIGQGPFREVRLLVDGMVAGAVFPYAVIFTGGIVPTAWRSVAFHFSSISLWWLDNILIDR